LIASNTSSISINQLARGIKNPERFCGAHFFSPVWMMQLLEIIRGEKTSPDTMNHLLAFCGAIKKRAVVCTDHPGFVVNALLIPYLLKAFDLLESGVPIEKIDEAMVKFGLPLGPIKLTDEVGIDIFYFALTKSLNKKAPQTIENMISAGRLGRKKSGKGFFFADGKVDPEAIIFIHSRGVPKDFSIPEIQGMLFSPFVAVGKELLEKGVVSDPRSIDIGAIWGMGFPADKGGPLKWADLMGLSNHLYGVEFYRRPLT
jgi:3-hydroxyacyl-CoA dehydrogenase